ncbi:carboxypeptidase-like regulatory domain-containing protein [Halalkalibaculum sp. DA384]|uniref:TonB-dependent receptor n=1 Tax=Halalkalibaculum sp. DA384 TaxID=3373606 RepID=UPI003755388C
MFYDKRLILLSFISIYAFLVVSKAQAQDAAMQGIISDNSTGQPLYGANVVLKPVAGEKFMGAAADGDGFYRISSIEPGTYSLRISYIGYRPYTDTLDLDEGENRTVNVSLQPDDAQLEEVVVEQTTGAVWKQEGRQRITPVELSRVPSPAAGDLATYLQTLPGVVSMGDRGGQVFIRGGTPTQNLVLLDGAIVYRPTHIVGFFSPFPEDLISGVDFYAGGFGPRYNSRVSSVMDIQMRHGDRYNFSGSGSVSPFAGEVFAEGPIQEGKSSWMFSARNSFIEQASSWLPVERQPLKFGSQLLKTSFTGNDDRCSAMVMNTYDRGRMDFEVNDSIKWRNFILGGNCIALPPDSRTLMQTNVNLSYFSNSRIDEESSGYSSDIWRVNLDMNLRQYIGDIRVDYGFFSRLKRLNYHMDEEFLGLNSESLSQFVLGGHLETNIPIGERLTVRPGAAITLYTGDYAPSLEPRFRMSWQPFGRETEEITAAAGLYRQAVTGISDMRDASSVFVAWMTSPVEQEQMEALHATLGWQQSLARGLTWSVEGYYKQMRNQPVPLWNTIARFTTDLAQANGEVYGSDLRMEYSTSWFYGMLGYGFSWTMYEAAQDHFSVWFDEPVQQYHPPHDRRHQVNALVSADIGSFTAGVRWQLGTGVPFTRPMGFDDILDFRERLPDVLRDQGLRRVILDKPYQGRLPAVHRLDMSLERAFRIIDPGLTLNARAGVVNIYDQTNIFYYDVYTHRRINQLPVLPYLTLEMKVGT